MLINSEKKARRNKYKALRRIRLARDLASRSNREFHKQPYKMSLVLQHFHNYLERNSSTTDIAYDIKLRMPGIIRRSRLKKPS